MEELPRPRFAIRKGKAMKRVTAEQRVLWAALSWQEYNDRVGSRWVRGSPISKLLTATRRLRKLKKVPGKPLEEAQPVGPLMRRSERKGQP